MCLTHSWRPWGQFLHIFTGSDFFLIYLSFEQIVCACLHTPFGLCGLCAVSSRHSQIPIVSRARCPKPPAADRGVKAAARHSVMDVIHRMPSKLGGAQNEDSVTIGCKQHSILSVITRDYCIVSTLAHVQEGPTVDLLAGMHVMRPLCGWYFMYLRLRCTRSWRTAAGKMTRIELTYGSLYKK